MVVISGFAFLLTIVGVYFVRENMLEMQETRRLSKESVDAAIDSNKIAREVGQAQVRAYLSCAGARYDIRNSWYEFHPALVNKGQSPARNIKIKAEVRVTIQIDATQKQRFKTIGSGISDGDCEVIPAGGQAEGFVVWLHGNFEAAVYKKLFEEKHPFSVNCRVSWDDVFGDEQSTTVVLDLEASDFEKVTYRGSRTGKLTAFNQSPETRRRQDQEKTIGEP